MDQPNPPKTDTITFRTSRNFKERLQEMADKRGVPMIKIFDEMFDEFTSRQPDLKPNPMAQLIRNRVLDLERDASRLWEEQESRANLFKEEEGKTKENLQRFKEELEILKRSYEAKELALQKATEEWRTTLENEKKARVAAEEDAAQRTQTATALLTSLNEVRSHLEEAKAKLVTLPELEKKFSKALEENGKLALEKENLELTLARVREDLEREKLETQRGSETYRRESQAMEREYEANLAKLQFEAEKKFLEKTSELERKYQEKIHILEKELQLNQLKSEAEK